MTTLSGQQILTLLIPPIELINWIESVFNAKRSKGQPIPAMYTDWLDLVRCIRTDLPSEIDQLQPEQWSEVAEIVGRYVTSSDKPSDYLPSVAAQAKLLNVPRKPEYA